MDRLLVLLALELWVCHSAIFTGSIYLIPLTEGIGAFYGKTDDEAAYKALTYSANRGMTFWDCADIYGTSVSYTYSRCFCLPSDFKATLS